MTDADERRINLGRAEMVAQWILAAITHNADKLDELQELTEQTCLCCVAEVTRTLAQTAAFLSVQLHGQADAEHDAEQALAQCLDAIAELDEDGP
jgi:hypothetical protein